MATVEKQLDVIFKKLDKMEQRLFRDNGNECIQSKVNRHEQLVTAQEKRWKWFFATTTVLFIMVSGRIIYDIVW